MPASGDLPAAFHSVLVFETILPILQIRKLRLRLAKQSVQFTQQLSVPSSALGCLCVMGWAGESPSWGPQPGPFHSTLDCILLKGTMSGNRGISPQNTGVGHHRILSCKILNPTNTSDCQGQNKGRERNPGGMSVHRPGRKTNQTVKERGTALSGSLSGGRLRGDTKTDSHFATHRQTR